MADEAPSLDGGTIPEFARVKPPPLTGWPARWALAVTRAREAEEERDRYLVALMKIAEEGPAVDMRGVALNALAYPRKLQSKED